MKTVFAVNWDNGASACGTFPQRFDTEEAAQQFADDWATESNSRDAITQEQIEYGEGYSAEVIELEEPDPEDLEQYDPVRDGWIGRDGRP